MNESVFVCSVTNFALVSHAVIAFLSYKLFSKKATSCSSLIIKIDIRQILDPEAKVKRYLWAGSFISSPSTEADEDCLAF